MLFAVDSVLITRDEFEAMVADAIDSIPRELAQHIDNVVVVVADWPTEEQLAGRPGTLLGLYEGVDLTRRTPQGYAGALPDRITIFRGPLCRVASDVDDLARRVRKTVIHEFAHHFGISDERLRELDRY